MMEAAVCSGLPQTFDRPHPLEPSKSTVFFDGFDAVAGLTKALPVVLIPKQFHVSLVRNDVIDLPCRSDQVQPITGHAQWIGSKELFPCRSPGSGVPTLVRGSTLQVNFSLVFLLVQLTEPA